MLLLEPLYVPVKRARGAAKRQSAAERKILVINGHPDPRPERFCAALCDAYETGAQSGAWQARRLNVGALALAEPETIARETGDVALELIRWSNRLVIVFPLWLDKPPQQLRILFDRLARASNVNRPASVVVTMEMPAFAHRAACRTAASGYARMIELPGVKTDKPIFIGCVDTISADQRKRWLQSIHTQGVRGL